MGTQGTGRKRSTKKERSTAEDDALNLIAREAEARLAAKRAARAEAREIRMKELERQQKELSDDDERMSVGSRGSVRVEDRDYLEKGSRAASAITAATLTSLGGTSSRRGSGETAINVDAETSIREIKDALAEVEEKYRKAMVSNAQLDNEKNNLMYQVDTLKDSLMELEELLSESRRGYEEKVKEFEREKHAHSVLQFQFNEMKETLKQSEELLNKHGIVLGPDLNINGDGGEAEVEGSPSADPASQPTQDSQTSPTEGNSMLGNTEDTQLRSSGEEEVDPEQHQEMVEEAEENHLNSDSLCNVADVPVLETSSEEQQTCLATEEDNVEESGLSKDLNVDIDDRSITEAKDINVCSPGLQGIVTSSEENVPETETPEGGDVVDISNPDLGETQTTSSSVETHSVDRESCNDFLEEQDNKGKDVERNSLSNTESCPQQKVAQDVMKESLPDGSVRAASNTEPQQEPENDRDAENDGAAEISNKSLPQGASASGKKKKKKRRSKKKGGTHEDKEQQKDGTATKKGKIEEDIESAAQDNETEPAEPDVENLKELRVVPVKNEQATQETEEVDRIEAVHPTENWSHNEPLKESRVDHVSGEQDKEQSSETENIEEVEAVATTETFSHTETPNEIVLDHVLDEQNKETGTVEAAQTVAPAENFSCGETLKETCTDPKTDEQDKEQTLESKMVEAVGSPASPVPETNLSTCDPIDNSKRAESSHGLDKMCTSSVENSKSEADISTNVIHTDSEIVDSVEGESGSVDGRKSECTTSKPKNTFERNGKENTEAQSQVPSHGPSAADESKSTNNSETNNNTSVSLCSTDGFTDGLKSLSGSEPPSELSATVELGSEVPDRGPEEATVTVKDDEEPGAETEQESFSASASHDGDNSGLKAEKEELSGDLREAEGLAEPDSPSLDEKRDSCASLTKNTDAIDGEKSLLETAVQAEQLDDVKSQTLQCEDPIDESNAAVSSETEEIDTINTLNTPDSPKEATEIGSSIKQDHSTEESAVAEDPEHNNSQKDQQSETPVCPSAEQLHEPSKDESGENDASQPTLEDSDEGGGEDEEGQSFDFDDVDMEAAIVTHLSKNPKKEEVEEGVEVMLDDSSNGSSELCQRNTESNESTPDEPESNAEKCTVDGGHQIDTLDKESDTVPQDNQHSSADEEAPSENACEKPNSVPEEDVGVAEEPGHIIEEGHVLNVGEVAVDAENINQAVSSPIEEGLDAMKHELQGEDLVLPKSADQVASNKEPPQTGKDAKKNSKRGKGKAKEDCKMS